MQKVKDWLLDHYVLGISAVMFTVCCIAGWLLYTTSRTENDYHNVTDTVQSAERDNREARQQIGNASEPIEHAQKQLSVSIKRTDRITERTKQVKRRVDDNSRIIGECQTLIDAGRRDVEEARGIFESVDQANKGNGTQTNRT